MYAVIGPTAVGKSAYAVALAKRLNGEIVSGDSMQVYRGMDIGTAKATAEEQSGVPHHLLDIADISEPFSAGRFLSLASDAIKDIHARGKTPIVCGGTGLYIELLLTGKKLTETSPDPALREKWLQFAEENGKEALHEQLRARDSQAAEAIHPNNVKRVLRALEICETAGMTKTEADAYSKQGDNPFEPIFLRLTARSREALYERIERRVSKMLADGLENEVRSLCARGLRETPTASQAIGYKEFYPYFDEKCTLAQVQEAICLHTRRYAKRQETWFSHMTVHETIFAD